MLIKYFVFSTIFILFGFFVFRVVVRNDYLNKLKLSPFSYSLEVIVFAVHANLSATLQAFSVFYMCKRKRIYDLYLPIKLHTYLLIKSN